jgi:hypothetical protein
MSNEAINETINNSKTVTIRITDNTGHTTLNQSVDETADTVIDKHFNAGKWVFVGAQAFQFTATSQDDVANLLADAARLKELLESSENAEVTLTGDLVGGAIIVAVAITGVDEEDWDQDRISELVQSIKEDVGADSVSIETDDNYIDSDFSESEEPQRVIYEFPRSALSNVSELIEETENLREFVENEDGEVQVVLVD